MNMKLTNGLLGLGALLMTSQVYAAAINLTPTTTTVNLGDSFILEVGGTDFVTGATAGSLLLTWDSSILQMDTANLASELQADGTGTGGTFQWTPFGSTLTPGSLDVSAFFTDTALGGDPFPVTGAIFDFLSVGFTVIGAPAVNPSDVTITAGVAGDWQDPSGAIPNVAFNSATVTVNAVPVPAAVWLFGSGLIGLVGIARRKTQLA